MSILIVLLVPYIYFPKSECKNVKEYNNEYFKVKRKLDFWPASCHDEKTNALEGSFHHSTQTTPNYTKWYVI
jgi:hypothetical protein